MKSLGKLLLAVLVSLIITDAHAMRWYSPNTGRWFSRDPISEKGGIHLYRFVDNAPLDRIDRFGLDVWIIKDASGLIRHRWVVGNNADGSYWSSDFMPNAQSLLGRICCWGTISFTKNNLVIDPKNLGGNFIIERHVKANQMATDQAKIYAESTANCSTCSRRYYEAGSRDCRDWAKEVADVAARHQNECEICREHDKDPPSTGPDAQ